jgi:hypothetical protein
VRTEAGAYGAFYAGLRDAVLGIAPPPVSAEDAAAGLEVLEAARAYRAATCRGAGPPSTSTR